MVRVQKAPDLVVWSGEVTDVAFVSQVNHGDGFSTVKYRSASPYDPDLEPRMFFRLAAGDREGQSLSSTWIYRGLK